MKDDGTGFMKDFLISFKDELGPSAADITAEDRDTIGEQRQRLIEAENQLQQAETLSSQREEEMQEVEDLRRKIEQTDAKIAAIQDEHGSNIESETELSRLKELKKNYQKDLENKKKRIGLAYKKSKNQRKRKRKRTSQG